MTDHSSSEPEDSAGTASLSSQQRALAIMLLGVCAIAFSPIWVRLSDLGPNAIAFWRLALSIPLLWIWSEGANPTHRTQGREHPWWPLLIPGLFFAADLYFWHWSITLTSVANATFIPNLAPLLVSLVAWQFLGERLRPLFAVGLSVAIAGVAMLVRASADLGTGNVSGDIFGLVTAVAYTGYLLSVKQLRKRYDAGKIMLSSALVGGVLLFILAASRETLWSTTWQGWLVLFGLAWISHTGGQGLIAYAIAYLPASFSSVTLLLQPVLAALFAWIILGEAVGWLQGLGGALVISGVALARQGSKP